MKKALALLLVALMSLSLIACAAPAAPAETEAADLAPVAGKDNVSASGESDAGTVFVDIWGVWKEDNYRPVWFMERAAEFAEQYEKETGIKVVFKYVYQDGYSGVAEKLTAGTVSKTLPVMAQVEESFITAFHPICADLSQYLDASFTDDILPGLKTTCTYNGKLLAVPCGRSYLTMFANVSLLDQAGWKLEDIQTWEDFEKCCNDVSALGDDIYGTATYWDEDAWPWESALYSNGGSVDNEDGTKIMFGENDVGAVSLERTKRMIKSGAEFVPYGTGVDASDANTDLFLKGKLGIMCNSITAYGKMKDALSGGDYTPFEFKIFDQPAGKAGKSVVTGGSNWIICDNATTLQKNAAGAFIAYMGAPENQVAWNETSGYMASTKAAYETDLFKQKAEADPNLLQIRDGIQYAHVRPTSKHWREMYTYIVPLLEDFAAYPDKYEPVELNKMMAEECQKIIDNAA